MTTRSRSESGCPASRAHEPFIPMAATSGLEAAHVTTDRQGPLWWLAPSVVPLHLVSALPTRQALALCVCVEAGVLHEQPGVLVEEDGDVAQPCDIGVGRICWQFPVLECPPIGGVDSGLP